MDGRWWCHRDGLGEWIRGLLNFKLKTKDPKPKRWKIWVRPSPAYRLVYGSDAHSADDVVRFGQSISSDETMINPASYSQCSLTFYDTFKRVSRSWMILSSVSLKILLFSCIPLLSSWCEECDIVISFFNIFIYLIKNFRDFNLILGW